MGSILGDKIVGWLRDFPAEGPLQRSTSGKHYATNAAFTGARGSNYDLPRPYDFKDHSGIFPAAADDNELVDQLETLRG